MEHQITPPPELVQQWRTAPEYANGKQMFEMVSISTSRLQQIATQAARWGADKELEACCEWFVRDWTDIETADMLRAARRPKPPSLKEQALEALERMHKTCLMTWDNDIIRRALELLDG